MRKTSYGSRSIRGANTQAGLMSLLQTYAKQNVNFAEFATKALVHPPSSLELR